MTERHAGYLVTLADDIREDSAYTEALMTAMRMLKGVIDVRPVPADVELVIAEERADIAWRERVTALLKESP